MKTKPLTKPLPDLPGLMPKQPNGVGMAALMLAVLAVAATTTYVGVLFAVPIGLVATVCGFVGRAKAKRGEATSSTTAVTGLALGAATALVSLGAIVWFCVSLSHAYDRPGELVSPGGKYEAPLKPGGTARYRDGMKVTVSKARRVPSLPGDVALRKGELTYEYTVTYVNDQDKALELTWNGIRTEKKILPGGMTPFGPMSPTADRKNPWFPDRLAPHQKVKVKMHVNVPPGSESLDFTASPTDYRDDAHWLLPLS
ncbi:DUF4190 domain-containing protein [Streptomyces sp. NPDC021096]|uniref:DUF4190 domain-containing protein n=1 Tax=Streptomyces sp. NPDC021096 TaxID=3154792 RepID=UPI0033CFAD41